MSRNRSFRRKICYLMAIGLLLPVLYWLGHPQAANTATAKGSPGGKLAQIRREQKLSQAQLGQIDPTSETIKLATFGLRPVAANILWAKAIDYKMKKDWTNLSATLNQLTKLQPNIIELWRFQGWNLAYNCSTEFDDYRQRYRWVIKGIEFIKLGQDYNEHEPRLLANIGWIISQKIGRADEHKQFRDMFREDDDFHGARPKSERDNWLVGKSWYRKAELMVDTEGVPITGNSPLIFRSKAPMCQMNYAEALEEDGTFGEKAKTAWETASREWHEFGQLAIPTTRKDPITKKSLDIRLGDRERHLENADAMSKEIDSLMPGRRQEIREEKTAKLTEKHRQAMAVAPPQRSEEQYRTAAEAQALLLVSDKEVAGKNTKAVKLAKQARKERELAKMTNSYRGIVNFDHWKLRAEVEQTEGMLVARRLVYEGDENFAQGNLPAADDSYRQGSVAWMDVLTTFPQLIPDRDTVEQVEHVINQYRKTLDQRDELFPADFALAPFVQIQVADASETAAAREFAQKAKAATAKGDLDAARALLRGSLEEWRKVMAAVPSLLLLSDRTTAKEITDLTRDYAAVLKKSGRPLSDSFPLQSFIWVQVEHDALTQAARKAADKQDFERSLADWRKVLDKYPSAIVDKNIADELMTTIGRYEQVLKKQDKKLPQKFILQDVVDRYRN